MRTVPLKQHGAIARAASGAVIITLLSLGTVASAGTSPVEVPNGWLLDPPSGTVVATGTMPQGAAASPDGSMLAIVESGFNPPALSVYRTSDLARRESIPLSGAFGRPVWIDRDHVLVAGANADAAFDVDIAGKRAQSIPMPKNSYPTAVAAWHETVAVATDGDTSVRWGLPSALRKAQPVEIGGHVGALAFSTDGTMLFASDRSSDHVVVIDTATRATRNIATGLHPGDLLPVGREFYVAESDADRVCEYDDATGKRVSSIFVGDPGEPIGVSPNALAISGGTLYASLGAANSVAVVRGDRVVGRIAAGWYPTDVVALGDRLLIVDGKGERSPANPGFDAKSPGFHDYVASLEFGSIRAVDLTATAPSIGNPQGADGWQSPQDGSVIRAGGPIKHVFFILKENRSYDEVLGDVAQGNGDPALVWFGKQVTPNEHAFAARFGLFDNTYASGEVSESGHNWSDAAFVNDYVERTWPPNYGGRGGDDDTLSGINAPVPPGGYIWQAAQAARVSFRDYGELTDTPNLTGNGTSFAPSLHGLYDPHYVGWNLDYSDLDRVREWRREFDAFIKSGRVPQLEWMWLPNDHTYGSKAGKLTPPAYVATNDYAEGLIVDAISHSPVWSSSAIFIIEDDAQDGADHVSDQRTTMFVVSPFARGGLQHAHYSTVSVLRTIELILGMKPMSTYDAMAVPLSAAFSATQHLAPYAAIPPQIDIRSRNGAMAFGAALSARLDFSRPDAIPPAVMHQIIAHNRRWSPSRDRN
jgi:YVTN family beta-propeller protein